MGGDSFCEYQALLEKTQLLEDIQAYDREKEKLAQGAKLIPAELTFRILDGDNPIKVWREYRHLSQQQLAQKSNISKAYLSQLETGKRRGSAKVLKALAERLERA